MEQEGAGVSDPIFVGLDGEMTHTEVNEGGRLCQIGIAFTERKMFVSDIGWGPSDYVANEQSLAVNKFTRSRIEKGPLAEDVDSWLCAYLEGQGGNPEKKILIAIGWNVGAFDMPFVKNALPNSFQFFSRRTEDLTAICFRYHRKIYWEGSYPTWHGWKRMAKDYATTELLKRGIPENEHDAGYDALHGIFCWEFLGNVLTRLQEK